LSGAPDDIVGALLAQSLIAWQLAGRVEHAPDGLIVVHSDIKEVRIARAPADLPFRWMVTADGRTRGAISLVAVLRQVRAALDRSFVPNRVRIALAPLVPS